MGDKELPSLLKAQTVPLSADAACNAVGSTATAAAVAAVATSTSTLQTTTESESGHRDGDTASTSTLLGKRKAVDSSPTTPQSTNNPNGSSKDDKPTNNNNNNNSTSTSGVKRKKQDWTAVQDETLMLAVSAFRKTKKDLDGVDWKFGEEDDDDWDEIARDVPGKSPVQCLQRYMRHLDKKDESSSSVRVVSLSAVDVQSSSTVPSSGSNNNNPVTLTESKVSCGRVLKR